MSQGVGVGVTVGVSVGSGVMVQVGVPVGVQVAWGVMEQVGVLEGVQVAWGVMEQVGVQEGVPVGLSVGVLAGEEGVKVWVGLPAEAKGLEGRLEVLLQAGKAKSARAPDRNTQASNFFMSGPPYRPIRIPAATGTSLAVPRGERIKLYFPCKKR